MTKTVVHLHCLHHRGPSAMTGVTKAYSLCGTANLVPRVECTPYVDDVDCPCCLRLLAASQRGPSPRGREDRHAADSRSRVATLRALRRRAP